MPTRTCDWCGCKYIPVEGDSTDDFCSFDCMVYDQEQRTINEDNQIDEECRR